MSEGLRIEPLAAVNRSTKAVLSSTTPLGSTRPIIQRKLGVRKYILFGDENNVAEFLLLEASILGKEAERYRDPRHPRLGSCTRL